MAMTMRDRPRFLERTSEAFARIKRSAREAGKVVLFSLEDVRRLVELNLGDRGCPYCRGPVTAASFVLGHKVPIERGGKFTFRNLEVCCSSCWSIKGVLDASEFREFWQLTAGWPRPVREHVFARLRFGALLVPAQLPPLHGLEWFTGRSEKVFEKGSDPLRNVQDRFH
jgi:hypothetical protein